MKFDLPFCTEINSWRQRAKVHWMREGDKSTKFFHVRASSREKKNTIIGFQNAAGQWCEEDGELESNVLEYFRGIFKSDNPTDVELNEVLTAIVPRVGHNINVELTSEFTQIEVQETPKGMHPLYLPISGKLSARMLPNGF
ncbi:hypothetical protein ACP275_13G059600 [Erythranthe tilingii]